MKSLPIHPKERNAPNDPIAESFEEYKTLWTELGIEEFSPVSLRRSVPAQQPNSAHHESQTLDDLSQWIGDCRRCGLCDSRKKIVVGSGAPKARLLFVGEGPGAEEDEQGLPFVGKSGELLTKIIEAMHLKPEEVYLTNIVKCRPPDNRPPQPPEIEQCLPFLKAQIQILQPELIVALGLTAANTLTGENSSMALLRGRFQTIAWAPEIPVLSTYHPAYLLRNPAAKKTVWEDMKLVMKRLKLS